MKKQRLLSHIRKIVDEYNLIEDGDKIAVGISAGKDSMTLVYALNELRKFYPKKFDIIGVTVSLGFDNFDLTPVKSFCCQNEIEYVVVDTNIREIVFDIRKEKNPCSLCAKMRKGAIVDEAIRLGCNKLAYGHNKDDIIETLFMSMFYEGRIGTFTPKTYLEGKNIYSIKPMISVPERDVIGFVNKYNIPVIKSPCTVDGDTKREETKNFVKEQRKNYDKFDEKIYNAIINSNIDGFRNGNVPNESDI